MATTEGYLLELGYTWAEVQEMIEAITANEDEKEEDAS